MTDTNRILEEALKLPEEARAALAGSLLDSLDNEVDENAEAEWSAEIVRRLRELDEGLTTTVPWAEARKQILSG